VEALAVILRDGFRAICLAWGRDAVTESLQDLAGCVPMQKRYVTGGRRIGGAMLSDDGTLLKRVIETSRYLDPTAFGFESWQDDN